MNIRAVLFVLFALLTVTLTGCGTSYYGYDYADPYSLNPYYGDGVYGDVGLYRYRYSPYHYRYDGNVHGYYGPGYYYRYPSSRYRNDFRRYDRDKFRSYRYGGRYDDGSKFNDYFRGRDNLLRHRNPSYLYRRDRIRDRNRDALNGSRGPWRGRSGAIDRFRDTVEKDRGTAERGRTETRDFNRYFRGPRFNIPESGK